MSGEKLTITLTAKVLEDPALRPMVESMMARAREGGRQEVIDAIVAACVASPSLRALLLRSAAGVLSAWRGDASVEHPDWTDEVDAELTLLRYALSAERDAAPHSNTPAAPEASAFVVRVEPSPLCSQCGKTREDHLKYRFRHPFTVKKRRAPEASKGGR